MTASEDKLDFKNMLVLGLISFLSLIDLFGPQAIGPALTKLYDVSPATMGFAINASTIGMAISGLAIALIARSLNQRQWIWGSLLVLTIPTLALTMIDSIDWFIALRVMQGICMAIAFTLTMAHISENYTAGKAASAMATYITGNVLSNLLGRLMSASIAEYISLDGVFYILAGLNVAGALLAFFFIGKSDKDFDSAEHEKEKPPLFCTKEMGRVCTHWYDHLRNPQLPISFALGFIILFTFIGSYTYVNYELAGDHFMLAATTLGLVYFVFLPSVITTPMAGPYARKLGVRKMYWLATAVSILSLLALLSTHLWVVLAGLAALAVGLFAAQAAVTGFVGQTATTERAAASGLYLSSYYTGGLLGALVLGQIYTTYGWPISVYALVALLVTSIGLSYYLRPPHQQAI